jgi:hypothetical protein
MLWSIIYKEIKATPFRAGCKDLNIFKIFFIKHGSNASPQLDRGLNGTEGEAFSIQQTFNFVFFYEGSPFNHKISGPEKNIWGWFSVPPDCPSYARCSSESMRGTMNRFENGTLDLSRRGGSQ